MILVSAPLAVGDRRVWLSSRCDRGSLARLRRDERVALTILTQGNVAFSARGRAQIVEEPMEHAPDYAAVAIDVDAIDDHRQAEFAVEHGVGREWIDQHEKLALGQRLVALRALAERTSQ